MTINRRDIIQMLRDESELLKVRNKQVSKDLARHQQAFRVLNELSEKTLSFTYPFDVSKIMDELLALVMHSCNTENGSIILIDDKTDELEFIAVIGKSRDHLLNYRISMDTGVVGMVIKAQKAVLIEDVHSNKKWFSSIDKRLDFQTHSLMCAHLMIKGQVVGAIEVVNREVDTPFDENDLNILCVASALVGYALERVEELTLENEAGE